jgi:hypothetical protein
MELKWEDKDGNKYLLGTLYKKDNYYYFEKNNEGLLEAMNHGCFGIGSMDLTKDIIKSEKLFSFFRNRIPSIDHPNIKDILKSYNLEEYDEMELLKRTHGSLLTDKYFLE